MSKNFFQIKKIGNPFCLSILSLNQSATVLEEKAKLSSEDPIEREKTKALMISKKLFNSEIHASMKLFGKNTGSEINIISAQQTQHNNSLKVFENETSIKESLKTDSILISEEKTKPTSKIRNMIDSRLKKELGRDGRDSIQSDVIEASRDSKDINVFTASKYKMESSGRDTEYIKRLL